MGELTNLMNPVLMGIVIVLAILILLCLVRAIKGPRVTDRVVAINMIGTLVLITICIFAIYLKESYLVDVAIVYAMISFLAGIVLCKVCTSVYLENKAKEVKQVENTDQ